MKKITPINRNESSQEVMYLHEALTALGFDKINTIEIQSHTAGATTERTVRLFQREYEIPYDKAWVVDDPTAHKINALLEEQGLLDEDVYIIRGMVSYRNRPVPGVYVQGFDQDLPSKSNPLEALDDAILTDEGGHYQIPYSRDAFATTEKQSADIVMVVSNAEQAELHRTPVLYNAGQEEVINIELAAPPATRRDAEFEHYVREITPLLGEVAIPKLTQEDIIYLHKETAIAQEHLSQLRMAYVWSVENKRQVSPPIFYALFRQGFPSRIEGWVTKTFDQCKASIERAVALGIVSSSVLKKLDPQLEILLEFVITKTSNTRGDEGQASVDEILSTVLEDTAHRIDFLRKYRDGSEDRTKFWESLKNDPELGDHVPAIQLAFQLSKLTTNNLSLIQAIRGKQEITRIENLIQWDVSAWNNLIEENGAPVPKYISGKDEAEKRQNYSKSLKIILEKEFSTQTVAYRVAQQQAINTQMVIRARPLLGENVDFRTLDIDNLTFSDWDEDEINEAKQSLSKLQREVRAFPDFDPILRVQLNTGATLHNPIREAINQLLVRLDDFSFDQTPVDTYFTKLGEEVWGGIEYKAQVSAQLRRMQRMYNVGGDGEMMFTLLELGMHSAHQMGSMPLEHYVQLTSDEIGVAKAYATHAKASQISDSVAMVYQTIYEYGKNATPAAVGNLDEAEDIIKDIPSYEKLFGAFDLCDCGHCRSVYSATAYFVDLLHQVLGGKHIDHHPALAKPIQELFKRRPDLQFIKLTCENTNTLIPYIDLVNEILETYVGFSMLSEAHTRDTSDFTAKELAANPQFLVKEAYDKLKSELFPVTLPFDLSLETSRVYLEHLGSSLYEVMRTYHTEKGVASQTALMIERLKLSEKEYEILTGKTIDGNNSSLNLTAKKLFGYTGNTNVIQKLTHVPELLARLEIDYETLISLLKISYINPHFQVAQFLQDPDVLQADKDTFQQQYPPLAASAEQDTLILVAPDNAQCDLTQTSILHADQTSLTENEFLKIYRFTRLWRKLDLSVFDTDLLLTKLSQINPIELNADLFNKIGQVTALHQQLKMPYETLLTFWSTMNTLGEKSLYEKLFLNKAALKIDDGFILNPQRDALKVTNQPIGQHIPTLLAALRISETNLLEILKYLQWDPASSLLTLENISTIYRYSSLAYAKRLKVEDFIEILELLDFDVFSHPETTQKFLTIYEKVSNSGFKIKELQYLYKHKSVAPDQTTRTAIMSLAQEITSGLKKIEEEYQEIQNINADEVRDKLGKIFDDDILQQAIGTLDNSFVYSTPLDAISFTAFPGTFNNKFSFEPGAKKLVCKGLMTLSEQTTLQGLSNAADYLAAIDDLFAQPRTFFQDTFYGFLQAGDIDILFNEHLTPDGKTLTSSEDRYQCFLVKLLPFLRNKLYHEWIKQSIAGHFEIAPNIAELLLEDVLISTKNPNQTIIEDMLDLKTVGWDGTYFEDITLTSSKLQRVDPTIDFNWALDSPDATNIPADNFSVRWVSKLSVPSTEEYTFYVHCDDGIRLWIDNQLLIDQWADQPLTTHETALKLKAGELYDIKLEYYEKNMEATISFQWSSPTMPRQVVSAEYLVPISALDIFSKAFVMIRKSALLINKFKLNNQEIAYFSEHKQYFEDFDLNAIPIDVPVTYNPQLFLQWLRLFDYAALRRHWPVTDENNLISVFQAGFTDFMGVKHELLAASGWTENSLLALLGEDFGQGIWKASADDFKNEIFLIKLQECIKLSENIGILEEKLDTWTALNMSEAIEEDIKNTVRAKYNEEVWPDVSKTIHDKIRTKQRNALVSSLLAQPELNQKNIFTTNDLYQYFLIDVEMEACMMTSRIVQANASIQLFVQRCLMNLEENIFPDMINEKHWKWMKKYRVWEANRKVFLYPENWIEPELRDDKSPFFKELENELLQGEINDQNVEKATINYLQKLDTVARLDIRAVHHAGGEVHVFGRTFNTPHNYYYRKYKKTKVWTPWAKVQTDIEGNYVSAAVWNNRLYLFWPIFTEKAKHDPQKLMSAAEPEKYFEVKLAWSEYHQGNWMPKQISNEFIEIDPTTNPYMLYTRILTDNTLEVYLAEFNANIDDLLESWEDTLDLINYWWRDLGKFSFSGCNKPATALEITMSQNNAHVTTFLDAYEEIYAASKLGYASENGNQEVLLNNKLMDATLCTEENFPRFRPGKTFFLQDDYKCYWVTSKPRERKAVTDKAPLDLGHIELPEWVDDHPLDLWWEQPVQDVDAGFQLEWDSPIIFHHFKNDIFDAAQVQGTAFSNNTTIKILEANNNGFDIDSSMYQLTQSDDIAFKYSSLALVDKYYWYLKSEKSLTFHNFYHEYVCKFVKSLNKDGIKGLFTIENQKYTDNINKFKDLGPSTFYVDLPYPEEHVDFDLQGAYSHYNWELFFHLPMLVANRLHQDQRFEEAQKWYHYVFNPTSSANESSPKRFWNVLPFKTTPQETLQQLMDTLNLPDGHEKKKKLIDQIEQWRDDPFKPHLIARLRPIAYMKNAVMKYLDNLIAWGDYLFRQDSLESINEATQLYILAAELLGAKPEKIPARGKVTPETYASLRPKLNEFSNAMVSLETYFPFYSESAFPPSNGNSSVQLKTTAQTLYFCLPDNENLLKYWDIVADRLFKIRHCQNIEGVERQLALFEPPIDPALLVKAVAGGLDIGSVLGDLNTPLPHYRFTYMLQKALEMTGELKTLGSLLLSALEKKDAEQLTTIRAVQETEMLKLVKEVKKLQISEARTAYEALLKSREIAVHRYIHYLKLLGEESPETPQIGASVTEVSLPSDKGGGGDGDKKLSSYEKQDLAKSEEAAGDQRTASMWETLANVSYYIPEIQAEPWGIGLSFGGSHVGPALRAISAEYQRLATKNSHEAEKASKLGSYFRREQDWVIQANLAAKEIMQTDKHITAAEIRVQIADKELQNHEQQIVDAQKIEEFLRNKYTNEELYGWMQGQIAALFFQSYKLAYDLAKKTEKTYRFENGLTSSNFIEFGYWDSFRKGLLSGEKLHLSLKRLEKDYLEKNRRNYEITKHIPLSLINPVALVKLKQTGVCEFDIPELLFDLDFPGQYFRRIQSVSLTIPCVVGPYTSVSAKLTLSKNRIRKNGNSQASYAYTGIEDTNFIHDLVGIQSVATSQAQGSNGLFELNFRDERYLPFEGAGTISTWRLELPTEFRAFDYNSISDVILHMNYTAREGGDALKAAVNIHVNDTLNKWLDELSEEETGLVQLISMRQEFSNEWHRFFQPLTVGEGQTQKHLHQLTFEIRPQHFPYFFRNRKLSLLEIRVAFKLKNEDDTNLTIGLPLELYQGKGELASAVDPVTNNGLQKGIANLPELAFDTTQDPLGWWQVQIDNMDVDEALKIKINDTSQPAPLDQKKMDDLYLIMKYQI